MALIAPGALAARLDDPGLAICDVRFYLTDHAQGRREFDQTHLPGAEFIDLHTELAGGPGGGRHPLPHVADFAAALGRHGIAPRTFVVAYDSAGGAIAARLWWMLRSIGHRRAAVLDGGYAGWVRAGLPVTSDVATPIVTVYPTPACWTRIVDADEVAACGATVIDSRSDDRYRGAIEPIDSRAGHIPGAINRFHGENLDGEGNHRPPSELAARFAGTGPAPIVYCGSGVTACHNLLAMELAGITDARLYPGSWSEWSSDPNRPIAATVEGARACPH